MKKIFTSLMIFLKLKLNFLFYFILPNWSFFFSKRINYGNRLTCNQKVLLTGQGNIEIEEKCTFGYKLGGFHKGGAIEIQPRYKKSRIKIGTNVFTNNNIFLCAANYIEIGSNTLIGQNVTIMDFEAHGILPTKRRQVGEIGKVIIGSNVWIGNNVIILKNTVVGDNCIIAAGAVISGEFSANHIMGGIPAKIIRKIDDRE